MMPAMLAAAYRCTASTVLVLLFAGPATGCRDEARVAWSPVGSCHALHRELARCDAAFDTEYEVFVKLCSQYPLDFARHKACAAAPGPGAESACESMTACLSRATSLVHPERRGARLDGRMERLREAMGRAAWGEVRESCERLLRDPDPLPEVATLCTALPERAVAQLTAEMIALRDAPGTPESHLGRCRELLELSAELSEDARRRAERLCREVSLALSTQATLRAARALAKAEEPRIPPGCAPMLRRLADEDTALGRRLRDKLIRACFVDMAPLVLEAREAGCTVETRRLLAAVDRWKVEAPALDEELARVRPLCRGAGGR